MVKLIGRTKFVDVVVRGTVGWQEGVRTFRFSNKLAFFYKLAYLASLVLLSSTYARYLFTIILTVFSYRYVIIKLFAGQRIYRCTMTHNMKSWITLFLEPYYETLTVECYWESRVLTTRLDNGRHRFSCEHYKETHLSKNMTFYQRMFNQYKVYKESVALKMYPTWEKSNPGELHMIAKKFGKVYQSNIVSKPHAHVKRKTTDDLEFPPLKHHNLAVKSGPKPLRSPTRSKPRLRAKAVIQCVKFEEMDDSEGHSDSGDSMDASSENHIEVQSPKEVSNVPAPAVELQNSKRPGCTSLGATSDAEAFHIVRHSRVSKHVVQPPIAHNLTRKELEDRVLWNAKVKFIDDNLDVLLPPPAPVEVNVIYVLITEAPVQWMPKELIEDPVSCIQHLYKMLKDGVIGKKIGNAFGQRYLYGHLIRSQFYCIAGVSILKRFSR
jgi:hypothetical protein